MLHLLIKIYVTSSTFVSKESLHKLLKSRMPERPEDQKGQWPNMQMVNKTDGHRGRWPLGLTGKGAEVNRTNRHKMIAIRANNQKVHYPKGPMVKRAND